MNEVLSEPEIPTRELVEVIDEILTRTFPSSVDSRKCQLWSARFSNKPSKLFEVILGQKLSLFQVDSTTKDSPVIVIWPTKLEKLLKAIQKFTPAILFIIGNPMDQDVSAESQESTLIQLGYTAFSLEDNNSGLFTPGQVCMHDYYQRDALRTVQRLVTKPKVSHQPWDTIITQRSKMKIWFKDGVKPPAEIESKEIPMIRYVPYDYAEENKLTLNVVVHLQDVIVNFPSEVDNTINLEKKRRTKKQLQYPMFKFSCETMKKLSERSAPVEITTLFLLASHVCVVRPSDYTEVNDAKSIIDSQLKETRVAASSSQRKLCEAEVLCGEILEKESNIRICAQCSNWKRFRWQFLCCNSCQAAFCSEICFREYHCKEERLLDQTNQRQRLEIP